MELTVLVPYNEKKKDYTRKKVMDMRVKGTRVTGRCWRSWMVRFKKDMIENKLEDDEHFNKAE